VVLDAIPSVHMPPPDGQRTDGCKSWVFLYRKSAFHLAVTLTFDLWPWKPFQQCPLTWWIFEPGFIEIPPLSVEVWCHVEAMLTDKR